MAKVTNRKDYRPYPFEVEQCQLRFEIQARHVIVSSRLWFRQNPKYSGRYRPADCILDGTGLEILSIRLNDREQEEGQGYRYDGRKLELTGTAEMQNFYFCAKVRIDPYNNKSLEGMYRSGDILCTQNEATGFRNITFYPDRPDVMSRFTTEIIADQKQYPRLLSNGNLLEKKDLGDGRHSVRWEDPFPKPAYLYALVAGDLDLLSDHFITCSGREVTLHIYTDKGKTSQARFAMESLKKAMLWDEKLFGREYDLDLYMIVAVDSFNFGAMENKGLNIFNSSLVFATDETATDATYENIASVIAHEYFHNWTGNRITCRDWFQLTLKEGLTVYRDERFSEDHFGSEVCRIQQVSNLRNMQYPEDAGPNRHPIRPDSFIDINNFYTQTVYEKGAAVIRMMAFHLGSEGFRKGMDRYFERFDGQAVTCDDFVDAIQEGGGKDLSLLRRWYEQAGTPQLYADSKWDGTKFSLKLRQENPNAAAPSPHTEKTGTSASRESSRPIPPPLAFPIPLALYDHNGTKLHEETIMFSERETERHYTLNSQSKPVPSLLLDHISPVEVHYPYSDEELLLLISADQDSFNRYEAMQRYQQKLLLAMNPEQTTEPADNFVERLRSWLTAQCAAGGDAAMPPRYLAQLLQVPGVQILAAAQQPPQFQALHQVREAYCTKLAGHLEEDMLSCYHALAQTSYERSDLAIGKRSLRNTLLHYLSRLQHNRNNGGKYDELASQQYQTSDNMTDSYAALQALTHYSPGPHSQAAEGALAHFSRRWQGDFSVLCRWFALQAGTPKPQTLQKIQELENHPLFRQENPNMLRSLYSVLSRNLPIFHDKSGAAYQFLAQRILQIDRFNSMTAAGLAKAFVAYKQLDEEGQTAMAKALQLILQQDGISDRLYEITSKTLEQ
ncbi:aminopeptidase N [Candidatus Haliotispira prima]|uniref:Aminopeptidase N n=1 Tax=Candidatus Haliotispira prima TaxID=3034016 RepID=A0ABY8MHY3_9SPIO|nr:aminopeptidase N [Candidatus Haliotispira prima]